MQQQAAEKYVEEYQQRFSLDYTILRYGSLYGPRSDYRNGLWRIVKNAIKTKKVNYEGSPEALREYIHVEDAARASIDALLKNQNKHVVLTGHEPMRVIDLMKMLSEILNLPDTSVDFLEVEHSGHYVRTPYNYQPQLGLKYTPKMHVDLGQGLLQLIGEIEKNIMNEEQ